MRPKQELVDGVLRKVIENTYDELEALFESVVEDGWTRDDLFDRLHELTDDFFAEEDMKN